MRHTQTVYIEHWTPDDTVSALIIWHQGISSHDWGWTVTNYHTQTVYIEHWTDDTVSAPIIWHQGISSRDWGWTVTNYHTQTVYIEHWTPLLTVSTLIIWDSPVPGMTADTLEPCGTQASAALVKAKLFISDHTLTVYTELLLMTLYVNTDHMGQSALAWLLIPRVPCDTKNSSVIMCVKISNTSVPCLSGCLGAACWIVWGLRLRFCLDAHTVIVIPLIGKSTLSLPTMGSQSSGCPHEQWAVLVCTWHYTPVSILSAQAGCAFPRNWPEMAQCLPCREAPGSHGWQENALPVTTQLSHSMECQWLPSGVAHAGSSSVSPVSFQFCPDRFPGCSVGTDWPLYLYGHLISWEPVPRQ